MSHRRRPSPKTACAEFGLTQAEIIQAIRAGKLQYRESSMYGNPWLRLLRREVEALVEKTRGGDYLKDRQAKTQLTRINGELRRLKREIAAMEERRSKLLADLEERGVPATHDTAAGVGTHDDPRRRDRGRSRRATAIVSTCSIHT